MSRKSFWLISIVYQFTLVGIGLGYTINSKECIKQIDCLDFHKSINIEQYAKQLLEKEPLLSNEIMPEFFDALRRLKIKLNEPTKNKYYYFKTLTTHLLPLTNVTFDKNSQKWVQNHEHSSQFALIGVTYFQMCHWQLRSNGTHLGCWFRRGIILIGRTWERSIYSWFQLSKMVSSEMEINKYWKTMK